jgi:hypothetical protein
VGVWKHIRRWWEKFNFFRFEVGVGSKVSFWHDLWCGDSSLKLCYPMLFSIARHKDASGISFACSRWSYAVKCHLYPISPGLGGGDGTPFF